MAKAANIVDGFKKIEAVMTVYYGDNYASSDAGKTAVNDLVAGVQAHVKDGASTIVATTPAVRKYAIIVEQEENKPEKWWIAYKIATEGSNNTRSNPEN